VASIVDEAQEVVTDETDGIDTNYVQAQADAWVRQQQEMQEALDAKRRKMIAALSEAFPSQAIKQRSGGGGKQLDYVSGDTVIRRLNKATEMTWNFEIISHQYDDHLGGMVAHVRLTIPDLGAREHVGVQKLSERGGEDLFKGAITDALKKAATLFNVGIDLYGDDLEAPPAPPVQVRKHPRIRVGEILKEQGVKGKAAFDDAAQKRFGKPFANIGEREAELWTEELEKNSTVPF